jgi:hypothetical protein
MEPLSYNFLLDLPAQRQRFLLHSSTHNNMVLLLQRIIKGLT